MCVCRKKDDLNNCLIHGGYAIITDKMNPELPSPQFTPEQAPNRPSQGQEYGLQVPNPEQVGERAPEREQQMKTVDRAPVVPQPPVAAMPMPVPAAAPTSSTPMVPDTPALANDDDLIEKEWVDKAKQIIAQTRNDPYRREQEVSRLQADYLFKRYGKELGAAE